MTEHFKNMLYLFGAGATGKDIKLSVSELNIDEIRRLAIDQGVWTVVYEPLSRIADTQKYRMEFLSAVSKSIQSRSFTLGVLKEMNDLGIGCCLLKGAAVAALYNKPDCRISGDTDILINPKDEKKVLTFLASKGYTIEKRTKNDPHTKAHHPIGGLMEVHIKPYSATTEKIVLGSMHLYTEGWRNVTLDGIALYTLGINDELMFLTSHFIKHLVHEGSGIRQMMDLLLFIDKHRDEIDLEKYNSTLEQLHYKKLIDTVQTVGAKYWNFEFPVLYSELADKIITDSEQGGVFGFSSNDRMGFYKAYCQKRNCDIHFERFFKANAIEQSLFQKLFPDKYSMQKLGYKADNLFQLSGAYVHRFYRLLTKGKLKSVEKSSDGCAARLELMKELNMID